KTPTPITAMQAGSVHARFAAKSQHILHRDDAKTRGRAQGSADECPVDAVVGLADICFGIAPLVISGSGVPPSNDRVVIVGAGVHDFSCSAVRQVHVRALVAESELQYGHARDLQTIPERVYFGSDVAEIFGEERQSAEGFAEFHEEIIARSIDPAAIDCRWIAGGNFPELVESAEVIEADVVAV